MSNQGNRDQEGNLGQPDRDSDKPAGTSGRQGNRGNENWQHERTAPNEPPSRPKYNSDDEEPGLGNRTGLR